MIVLITIYCEVMVMVLERRFSGSYNKLMKMIKGIYSKTLEKKEFKFQVLMWYWEKQIKIKNVHETVTTFKGSF